MAMKQTQNMKVICNQPGRDAKAAENCLLLLNPTSAGKPKA